MRAQGAALSDIGDLALGEGTVAPVSDARGIELLGDNRVVTDLQQLVDLCNDIGWDPLAWRNGGSCHRQGVIGTTPQSQVGCDLGMLAQDGHILDEKCKDLLALAVDDGRISPELWQVATERTDAVLHVDAQLLLGLGMEACELFLDRRQLGQACIPLRFEAAATKRLAGSTNMKRRRAKSLS
jgi:hypothetical protein